MNHDGTIMSTHQFYTTVTVHNSVHNPNITIPQWACTTLIKHVTALWANTLRQWLLTSSNPLPPQPTEWWHASCNKAPFSAAKNKNISRWINSMRPPPPTLRLIKVNNTPATICWSKERTMLAKLAPSRRDLMLRLIRNALPLGIKRIHWDTDTQKHCMLCSNGSIETADHIFWRCQFAKDTWADLWQPWRNHRNAPVSWIEILKGCEVRLNGQQNKIIDQTWSIVRACIIRVIWLERNRRYFYANLPQHPPNHRHNQGTDDIKAHLESWCRRAKDKEKEQLLDTLTFLAGTQNYNNIISSTCLNTGNHNHLHPDTPNMT